MLMQVLALATPYTWCQKKLRCITIKEKQTCRYGFTPHSAEQPLQGMELNEKEEKDENHILIRIRSRHLA